MERVVRLKYTITLMTDVKKITEASALLEWYAAVFV
jgi:hypothetical protein